MIIKIFVLCSRLVNNHKYCSKVVKYKSDSVHYEYLTLLHRAMFSEPNRSKFFNIQVAKYKSLSVLASSVFHYISFTCKLIIP